MILSTAKATNNNSLEITFTLVGIVFAILVVVMFYQFFYPYITKLSLWLKFSHCLQSIKLKKGQEDTLDHDD